MVTHLESAWHVSERRACRVVHLARSTCRYQSISKRDDTGIIIRMREITETRVRYGYRRVSPSHRLSPAELTQPGQRWAMDFVADELFDGIRVRALTVVDEYSRECLAITVGQGLTSKNVVTTLRRCRHEKGDATEDQD